VGYVGQRWGSSLITGSGREPAFHSSMRQPWRPGRRETQLQLEMPPKAGQLGLGMPRKRQMPTRAARP
jgi:hypothetical protein